MQGIECPLFSEKWFRDELFRKMLHQEPEIPTPPFLRAKVSGQTAMQAYIHATQMRRAEDHLVVQDIQRAIRELEKKMLMMEMEVPARISMEINAAQEAIEHRKPYTIPGYCAWNVFNAVESMLEGARIELKITGDVSISWEGTP